MAAEAADQDRRNIAGWGIPGAEAGDTGVEDIAGIAEEDILDSEDVEEGEGSLDTRDTAAVADIVDTDAGDDILDNLVGDSGGTEA